MKPPTITGMPPMETADWIDPLNSTDKKIYKRMSLVDATGRIHASSVGPGCAIPITAENIKIWSLLTYSWVPLEPDVVGSYVTPPPDDDVAIPELVRQWWQKVMDSIRDKFYFQ